jgi:hypothetical protein
MKRVDFIKKVIQAGLFAVLIFIVFALKNRIVAGGKCSSCPENGNCSTRECSKY